MGDVCDVHIVSVGYNALYNPLYCYVGYNAL